MGPLPSHTGSQMTAAHLVIWFLSWLLLDSPPCCLQHPWITIKCTSWRDQYSCAAELNEAQYSKIKGSQSKTDPPFSSSSLSTPGCSSMASSRNFWWLLSDTALLSGPDSCVGTSFIWQYKQHNQSRHWQWLFEAAHTMTPSTYTLIFHELLDFLLVEIKHKPCHLWHVFHHHWRLLRRTVILQKIGLFSEVGSAELERSKYWPVSLWGTSHQELDAAARVVPSAGWKLGSAQSSSGRGRPERRCRAPDELWTWPPPDGVHLCKRSHQLCIQLPNEVMNVTSKFFHYETYYILYVEFHIWAWIQCMTEQKNTQLMSGINPDEDTLKQH